MHPDGEAFALKVMKRLEEATKLWKQQTGIGFGLYGSPAESLCYRFAKIDLQKFGEIKDVTDKGYYTNSYHVDVREEIDAFKKLEIEGEYLALSSGGAVSYVETADLNNNPEAIIKIIQWMNDHIIYAEVNRKIGAVRTKKPVDCPSGAADNGDVDRLGSRRVRENSQRRNPCY